MSSSVVPPPSAAADEAATTEKYAPPVRIDVVSDVVCPWCFIGKARLEKALALIPDVPVDVRFHPYFLNPWVPREGMSRDDYLTRKFGSPDHYKSITGRVQQAAAQEGLVYDSDKMKRQPNTLDAHRLILWAGSTGQAARMKQRLMDLYFTEGGDLSDPEVLVKAASDVGLDADKVREMLASDADIDTVSAAANAAKEAGIDGVPTYIFNGVAAVSGAQEPEVLARAIEQIAKDPERFRAAANTAE